MNKYSNLHNIVYSVFGSSTWQSEGIPTYPVAFNNPGSLSCFIRVDIVASGENLATFPTSTAGQLIIDIFFPNGDGNKKAIDMADTLDKYFAGKSLFGLGHLQLSTSTLVPMGIDLQNTSLMRYKYSVSFNYYGV